MAIKKEKADTLIYHKPVLIDEVLTYLNPQPGKRYLDVTFGSGGHTRAILEYEPRCSVIAMDWDAVSLDTYAPPLQETFGERLSTLWGNFANVYRILKKAGIDNVDGILADFGTSQMQIKGRPGFSIYLDTPLDMRMSPPHQRVTAAQIINKASEEKLREIFWQLGEERHAKRIAQAIVNARRKKKIKTTRELAAIVERVLPRRPRATIHPATKVFQALRLYINRELDNISAFLAGALKVLNPEGRLVCISFHSLEDRLVKQFFKDQEALGALEILTKKVVIPTAQEIRQNPSSRSAKLRAAMVLGRD